jgi:hypothetical protein
MADWTLPTQGAVIKNTKTINKMYKKVTNLKAAKSSPNL